MMPDAEQSNRAITRPTNAKDSDRRAPQPGGPAVETKAPLAIISATAVARLLRSRRFYEGLATAVIVFYSLREFGQENRATMLERLVAWNRREAQRLQRKTAK